MPVHAYGGSISVDATRTVAAGGKIKIAPGNAEAKQVEDPYPGGQEKMPVHVYGGSISVNAIRTVAAGGKIKIALEMPGRSKSKTLIRADKKECLYTHTAEAFQRRYFRIDFRNWERSRSSATSSDKLRKDIEKSALKGFCPCAGAGVATKRLLMRREATPIKTNRGA